MTPAQALAMAAADHARALQQIAIWREMAQQAIHRLSARDRDYAVLERRYRALLDEMRAAHAPGRRAA